MSDKNKSTIEVSPGHGFSQIYNDLNSRTMPTATPIIIIILIIVIFAYFFLFNSLGGSTIQRSENRGLDIIEIIMWGLFVFLVLINGVFVAPQERNKPLLRDGDTLAIWPPVAGG